MHSRIYLDHAATTPVARDVLAAMLPYFSDAGFNPSSLHAEGRRARAALDEARDRVARSLGAARSEITFTGSGSEADTQAILGVARANPQRRHVISTAVEHHAVLHALDVLRDEGYDVTLLEVDERGALDVAEFAAAIRPDTLLATVVYANNETGVVAPIPELAAIARARGVLFHTDAVQAPGWLPIGVESLGVSLLSLSAHKFYGPKGTGVLYVRRGIAIAPLIYGGGQEFGRRSGTENLAGIVGLAAALERVTVRVEERAARVRALRDRLEEGIRGSVPEVRVNGGGSPRLPNIANLSFAGVDSEAMLARLDLEGIAVSAGSACTSGALEPSHVIAALKNGPRWQQGVIRFSLGEGTTTEEVDRVVQVVAAVVEEIRGAASSRV